MISLLLAVLLLFFCPLFLMSQRQEAVWELAAMGILTDFTERWKQSGEITRASYEEALERLAASGSGWSLVLEHQRRIAEPVFKDGEVADVFLFYEVVPFAQIEEQIYGEEGVYKMHQEDRLAVRLERWDGDMGSRLRAALFGADERVRLHYGGIVVNEPE